jgi:hypothetical protein
MFVLLDDGLFFEVSPRIRDAGAFGVWSASRAVTIGFNHIGPAWRRAW